MSLDGAMLTMMDDDTDIAVITSASSSIDGEVLRSARQGVDLSHLGALDEIARAVLTLSWADIDSSDDSEDEEIMQPTISKLQKTISSTTTVDTTGSSSTLIKSSNNELNNPVLSFRKPWDAWYDPPRGREVRQGIDSASYERSLIRMGCITNSADFWTVHELIDWNNLPTGSMVSFGEAGSKPFWEDPAHCKGGRWVIRGFAQGRSEELFARTVLSVFCDHFADPDEFTCVSLQVKDRRHGNTIQLWTRSRNYKHVDELQQHITALCYNEGGNKSSKVNGSRRGRSNKSSQALTMEFCVNSEAIRRNHLKMVGGSKGGGKQQHTLKPSAQVSRSVASRCLAVSDLYTAGRLRKKNKDDMDDGDLVDDWRQDVIRWGSNQEHQQQQLWETPTFATSGFYDSHGCWYPYPPDETTAPPPVCYRSSN